ncbi:MAG: flagellar biosynthesis protein FlhB [Desulfohalobiaceae bacterium]|nr:flagellar biosynthesis protein FlhB [Desulfohalobiaceae bacterium]
MANDEQQEERTEEPTEKRRREFREEGKVAQSQEVNTALLFSAVLLLWYFYIPEFWERLQAFLSYFWREAGSLAITSDSVVHLLLLSLKRFAVLLWPFMLTALIIGIAATAVQIGWLFTLKPLQPKASKMNPIKGVARLVSKKALFEVVKSLMKIAVVGIIVATTIMGNMDRLLGLSQASLGASLGFFVHLAGVILLKCCLALLFVAVLDYLYQRHEMEEEMKMTKKELQDENKETEGDPQLKQKMKSVQKEMANKRMMAEVPESDVVITNPTHIAVALAYRRGEMDAPQVMAKGSDHLAQRIRSLAEENDVPVVQNPPLAQALNRVDLGESIPEEMYKAVAEILAYVYSLKGQRL